MTTHIVSSRKPPGDQKCPEFAAAMTQQRQDLLNVSVLNARMISWFPVVPAMTCKGGVLTAGVGREDCTLMTSLASAVASVVSVAVLPVDINSSR